MPKLWNELKDVWGEFVGRFAEKIEFEWRYRVVKARLWKEEREIEAIKVEDQEDHDYVSSRYAHLQPEWQGLSVMETRKLLRRAARAGVELPEQVVGDFYARVEWDTDNRESYYLTEKGMQVVAAALRQERKERRDELAFRFGIVVGGIGALTGLLSVFMR